MFNNYKMICQILFLVMFVFIACSKNENLFYVKESFNAEKIINQGSHVAIRKIELSSNHCYSYYLDSLRTLGLEHSFIDRNQLRFHYLGLIQKNIQSILDSNSRQLLHLKKRAKILRIDGAVFVDFDFHVISHQSSDSYAKEVINFVEPLHLDITRSDWDFNAHESMYDERAFFAREANEWIKQSFYEMKIPVNPYDIKVFEGLFLHLELRF